MELLKDHEIPDPNNQEDFTTLADVPESEFRIKWIDSNVFEFSRFVYVRSRGASGWGKTLPIRVEISGHSLNPDLLVRVQGKSLLAYFLKMVFVMALFTLMGLFVISQPGVDEPFAIFVYAALSILNIFIIFTFFSGFFEGVRCLRRFVARDDWDK